LTLTLLGVLIGEGGSLALSRLLQSLLFETSATDGFSYIGVGAIVAAMTLLACYLPARRASRFDQVSAMRAEVMWRVHSPEATAQALEEQLPRIIGGRAR
jgi:ABC-type lipoprotein release transport system permease subunit